MIRRPPRSTKGRSSAASDVYKRQVVTTGGSVIKAINAVCESEAEVKKLFVIVDREEGAKSKFEDLGVEFFSIFQISELL